MLCSCSQSARLETAPTGPEPFVSAVGNRAYRVGNLWEAQLETAPTGLVISGKRGWKPRLRFLLVGALCKRASSEAQLETAPTGLVSVR